MGYNYPGITDGPESAVLQMKVAKMVTCAPSGMVKEQYLQRLSTQVIELLHFALEIDDKVIDPFLFLRVVTFILYEIDYAIYIPHACMFIASVLLCPVLGSPESLCTYCHSNFIHSSCGM